MLRVVVRFLVHSHKNHLNEAVIELKELSNMFLFFNDSMGHMKSSCREHFLSLFQTLEIPILNFGGRVSPFFSQDSQGPKGLLCTSLLW